MQLPADSTDGSILTASKTMRPISPSELDADGRAEYIFNAGRASEGCQGKGLT